ncbi:hypothetical protein RND71_025470 [Anisodus tanguticus]|uniref:Uncharacterized protein n=1 Tax=Anisodus tanguticus TaxID=243964 RepID=A0AAE1VCQ6_9SOLA|nr:hypothetical protein RND71_025470 [Anisodus tanguticus]
MGYKSRYQDQTYYYETVSGGNSSRRRYLQSTRVTQRWIPRPVIPSWEKEFCLKIGSFTWENFLYRKKCICHFEKVLNWSDLAAEEAFQHAKNKFYVEFHNFPFVETFKPNPDLYIDEIDWNSDIDPKLLEELELALMKPEEEEDQDLIPIEEIIPTGCKVLTGLIINCGEGEPQVSHPPMKDL